MHKKTIIIGNCWIWEYAKNKQGYGQLQINKKRYEAHRWLYILLKGEPPHKTELDHLCRNRACINPEHLEPVSHAENCRRGYNAKLDEQKVIEIKKLFGKKSQTEIAKIYGVSRATIGYIFQGKRWL
jgi:DNA-directed RNA polymerase specialized sigma subunit